MYPLHPRALNFLAISAMHCNSDNCDVVGLGAPLDRQALKTAIDSLLEDYEILRCILVKKWNGYFWKPANLKPVIEFKALPALAPEDVDAYFFTQFRKNIINPFTENPVRFYIYEGRGQTYLQVLSSHLIADGRSCAIMVKNLLSRVEQLQTGQPLERMRIKPQVCDDSLLWQHTPRPSKLALLGGLLAKVIAELGAAKMKFTQKYQAPPTHEMIFHKVEYGQPQLQGNVAFCKKKGVTFHALFLQVIGQALSHTKLLKSQSRIKIMDTFCLRRFAPEQLANAYGLYMVPHPVFIPAEDNPDIKEIYAFLNTQKAGAILAELYRQKIYASSAQWLPLLLVSSVVRSVSKTIIKTPICLTNLGQLESWMFTGSKSLPIESYSIYSTLFAECKLAMVASTRGNGLQMTFVACPHFLTKAQLSGLAEQIGKELQKNIEKPLKAANSCANAAPREAEDASATVS